MTLVAGQPLAATPAASGAARPAQRTSAAKVVTQALIFCGAIFAVWQSWTVVAWLSDHPHSIVAHDGHSVNWWACRVLEALIWLASLPVIVHLVRGCRRDKKVFTFDVIFCLAAATMFWGDIGINFFQPIFLISANFVNLNSPLGHMPGVVNPTAGRSPDPMFWLIPTYAFLLLGIALVVNRSFFPWVRRHRPGITDLGLFWILFGVGAAIGFVLEVPSISLHMWQWPGAPKWITIPVGHGYGFPATELLADAVFFSFPAVLWVFRNDRGETLVERGVAHMPLRRRGPATFLALYGFFQLMLFGPAWFPDVVTGPYLTNWQKMPTYLINDQCDTAASGVSNTGGGLCPGSPGYEAPIRHLVLTSGS